MDWFRVLFGFEEKGRSYAEVQAQFELVGKRQLRSRANGATFDIGTFECLSLAVLREHALGVGSTGQVRVSHVASNDVFLMHCDPSNHHAVFQAASQFNCLEFAHPRAKPENGVTIYALDMTQGPACAIAAGPATVFRNYLVPMRSNDANGCAIERAGQTGSCQINNLDDIEDLLGNEEHQYFHVVNGYTDATNQSLARLNTLLSTVAEDALCDALKIGVHWHAQVPFRARYKMRSADAPKQLVTQAYCSALSCGYSYASTKFWAPFARLVLKASYEAALWTAVINAAMTGCHKVYLTILGGGVFANEQSWIIDAIALAVNKCREFELDVIVVHYKRVDVKVVNELEKAMACLE
ncbi:hypothetical protein ACHHYP_07565 [Achlya hypogyna]|uniref:Macro domain-containing protein n=1 Tax=Achlya hypogyna TaxID=1202772 RepID=A0A1V9YR91_ACHHY|nr:hypothetical protein ACHHYP_07565 [Achlya hypogyna]